MVTMSSDVELPRGTTPEYPPYCPVCFEDTPGDLYVLRRARVFSWLLFLSPLLAWLMPGRREEAHVPACRECVGVIRRQHFWRGLFGYACVALAVALAVWLGLDFGRHNKWLFAGIALLAFLPQIAWDVVSARHVDMTVWKSTVEYEFRDEGYAEEFAELNDGTVE